MELLYVVCQLAAAEVCEQHRAMVLTESPLVCVHAAPAELAQIVPQGWRVARWGCNAPRMAVGGPDPAPEAVEPAALTE